MKKQFIFVGPPACGKGTQTAKLCEKTSLVHIDTGSLLRNEIKSGTQEGKIAKEYVDKGQLVPAELVSKMIAKRLEQQDCQDFDIILDGYPRSIEQALSLDRMNEKLFNDNVCIKVIYFDVDINDLIERIVNRRSCPKCGKIYNLKYAKPKVDGICDNDGERLLQRNDDTQQTAKSRFQEYLKNTQALVDFYQRRGQLYMIDATGSVDEIFNKLIKIIG